METADQDPNPAQPKHSSLPLSLHHQTNTADDCMEEPEKETVTDTQLPLTANPLPPGGSKPRHGQKKRKEGGQMPYGACMRSKTGANSSRRSSESVKSK